jgi:hypothetical protein
MEEYGDVFFCCMPLYTLDVCPENRDESNGDSIIKLSLQFIPIFGALHSQLRKGHTTKKDISMFRVKKTSHLHAQCKVSSMNNPEAKREGHLLTGR